MKNLFILLFALLSCNAINAQTWEWSNPAKDHVSIETQSAGGAGRLVIANAQGQEIRRMNISGRKMQLNICDLPNGVYFLQVIHHNMVHAGKLVKE